MPEIPNPAAAPPASGNQLADAISRAIEEGRFDDATHLSASLSNQLSAWICQAPQSSPLRQARIIAAQQLLQKFRAEVVRARNGYAQQLLSIRQARSYCAYSIGENR